MFQILINPRTQFCESAFFLHSHWVNSCEIILRPYRGIYCVVDIGSATTTGGDMIDDKIYENWIPDKWQILVDHMSAVILSPISRAHVLNWLKKQELCQST